LAISCPKISWVGKGTDTGTEVTVTVPGDFTATLDTGTETTLQVPDTTTGTGLTTGIETGTVETGTEAVTQTKETEG
jgi:hypothetical protein